MVSFTNLDWSPAHHVTFSGSAWVPGSSSKTTKIKRLTLSKLDFYFLARIKIRSQKKVSSSQKCKIAISKIGTNYMWAGCWIWFRILCPPCSFLSAFVCTSNKTRFTLWHFSFIEKTLEMNESRWNFWNSIFYRIKKFDLKKKLELTEGSFWTTFWKYHVILCWSWYFKKVSKNYIPLVPTFFLDRIFWFGKK